MMNRVDVSVPPVSVIMAAYNEQAFIETTVASIVECGFPCEIIVVDDGSTDRTAEIIASLGGEIKVITHAVNRGKGAAMASGLRAATGEIVIFCDAHLVGLRQQHLLAMTEPLVHGSAAAVLGVDVPERLSFSLANRVPFFMLTGQRAYRRADLLPLLSDIEDLGYGVETYLFTKFPRNRTALVTLSGLVHLNKRHTSSFTAATMGYLRESVEIVQTLAKVQGLVPKRKTAPSRRVSALLARYTGTRPGKP